MSTIDSGHLGALFHGAVAHPERLVTAILVEIHEKWATSDKPYISWKAQDD